MHVAIPSKGRAGDISSHRLIPSGTLYVPEGEAPAYQKLYPNVVGVPLEVRGITATRNWILDAVDDRHIVMIDDDVVKAGWHETGSITHKWHSMAEARWLKEWHRLFDVTEDLQYHLWGVENTGDFIAAFPNRPFIFHTYVTASCMGIINDGIRFDPEFPVKEDYELCLRMIRQDGGIVGARYLFWQNQHWTKAGGCRDYRTQEMEQDCIERLIRMYPGMIRQVKAGKNGYRIKLDF